MTPHYNYQTCRCQFLLHEMSFKHTLIVVKCADIRQHKIKQPSEINP